MIVEWPWLSCSFCGINWEFFKPNREGALVAVNPFGCCTGFPRLSGLIKKDLLDRAIFIVIKS
jgi:hypothetical protein